MSVNVVPQLAEERVKYVGKRSATYGKGVWHMSVNVVPQLAKERMKYVGRCSATVS